MSKWIESDKDEVLKKDYKEKVQNIKKAVSEAVNILDDFESMYRKIKGMMDILPVHMSRYHTATDRMNDAVKRAREALADTEQIAHEVK
jgi:uncharacterized protein YukE